MVDVFALSKVLNGNVVLNGINTTFYTGSITAIIGEKGTGKSTFIKILAGLYEPSRGEIEYSKVMIKDDPSVRSKIAFVGDELVLPKNETPRTLALEYARFYPKFSMDAFYRYLLLIDTHRFESMNNMSYPQQKFIMLALALSSGCEFMFFDDPLDKLDPKYKRHFVEALRNIKRTRNVTIVYTTNFLKEFNEAVDAYIYLEKTRILSQNLISVLFEKYYKFQAAFPNLYSIDDFAILRPLHVETKGRMAVFIVKNKQEVFQNLHEKFKPTFLEKLDFDLNDVYLCAKRDHYL